GVMVGTWPQSKADNCLLIRLRTAAGKLASVQAIFSEKRGDRDKDFLKGGSKKGAFFGIGDLEASPVILIAEGYATAATLHAATGHAAVMAMDAGNLKPVAQAIRALYPDKTIVICADNDRKTDGNPGLTKATDAAQAVNARLAVPEFAEGEDDKTDFNDLAGIDAEHVLKAIAEASEPPRVEPEPAAPPPVAAVADSESGAFTKHDTRLMRKSGSSELLKNLSNAITIVANAYPGLVGFNEFRQRIEARFPTKWRKGSGAWTEYDTAELADAIAHRGFPSFNMELLSNAVMTVAHRNPFNPAQDRLRALAAQWDGVNRIENWLVDYLNAGRSTANSDYLREIGAAWLKGVTARVLSPGCKRDDVLVLRGPQGWLKSTAANSIAECIHPDSFTDNIGDLSSKDSRAGIRGMVIAELAELAALNKSDIESVKAFVAGRNDHFREAYGRGERDYPRTVSFIGTTNDPTFLKDPSGNRRWWPVTISAPIDIQKLESVLPQLIGEAASRVLAGEPWHVKDERALAQANDVRAAHYADDVWTDAVLNAAKSLLRDKPPRSKYVTVAELMSVMGLRIEQQTIPAQMRVGGILRVNQFESKRKRIADRL
ncbi:MAG: toprim domain-containing protein, partial [Candidatus Competibacteraceae bacterium]|nr:toprim domain-containing protein [Candidatus Competibacteraceae bacterium]